MTAPGDIPRENFGPTDGQLAAASPELRALAQAWCDDTLGPADAAQLESLLRGDCHAQMFFWAHLQVHARLQWDYRGSRDDSAIGDWAGEPRDQNRREDRGLVTEGDAELPDAELPIVDAMWRELGGDARGASTLSQQPPQGESDWQSPGSGVVGGASDGPIPGPSGWSSSAISGSPPWLSWPSLVLGALVVLMGAVIVWGVLEWPSQGGDGQVVEGSNAHRPDRSVDPYKDRSIGDQPNPSGTVGAASENLALAAIISGTKDAVWGKDSPTQATPKLAAGSVLRLESGLAEITFRCQARVALRGPAVLRIESDKVAHLLSGTATAHADDRDCGFSMRTPLLEVLDLGTEFGVRVSAEGETEVQVFEGKVEAAAHGSPPSLPMRLQLGKGESLRLARTSAPEVNLETSRGDFPPFVPPSRQARFERWQAFRKQLIADRDLVGYWSFDGADAADLSRYGHHGALVGGPKFSDDVPEGLAGGKSLDVSGAGDLISVPHADSLSVQDQMTVAFWMKGDDNQQRWARCLAKAGRLNGSGWVVHRADDLDQMRLVVGTSEGANQSTKDVAGMYNGNWRHFAVTVDRGTCQMYVDGVAQGQSTYRHGRGLASTVDLIIGAAGADQRLGAYDFNGKLDEVALFRRALSADEVRALAEGGRIVWSN